MNARVVVITHLRPCELGSLPNLAQASRRTSLRDVPGVASILACRAVESTTTSLNTMVRIIGLVRGVQARFARNFSCVPIRVINARWTLNS
jgi:hypothetical protein